MSALISATLRCSCDAVGEAGHVIAVEPNPEAVRLLTQSVLLNGYAGRTRIVPSALGASAGQRLLFVPGDEPKNAALVDRTDFTGRPTRSRCRP